MQNTQSMYKEMKKICKPENSTRRTGRRNGSGNRKNCQSSASLWRLCWDELEKRRSLGLPREDWRAERGKGAKAPIRRVYIVSLNSAVMGDQGCRGTRRVAGLSQRGYSLEGAMTGWTSGRGPSGNCTCRRRFRICRGAYRLQQ